MEELNLDLQSTPNIVPIDLNENNSDKTKITITKSEDQSSPILDIKKVNSEPNLTIFTKDDNKDKIVPTMGLELLTDKKKVKESSSNDNQTYNKDDILNNINDKPLISSSENTDDVLNFLDKNTIDPSTKNENISNIDIASLDLNKKNDLSNFDFFPEKKTEDNVSNVSFNLKADD